MPDRRINFPGLDKSIVVDHCSFNQDVVESTNFCLIPKIVCDHSKVITPSAWLSIGLSHCPFCGILFILN